MSKVFTWLALCAAVLGVLLHAPQAFAREQLWSHTCFLPADSMLTFEQAEADAAWNCDDPAPEVAEALHGWMRIDDPARFTQGEAAVLESDAAAFDGLLVVLRFADGSQRQRYWDDEALARHWTAGTRFSIPLFEAQDQPSALFVRIDRPFSRHVAYQSEIATHAEADRFRLVGMIGFSMLFGMLLVSMVYSLVMVAGMRQMAAVFHAGIACMISLYTFSSGSLLFAVFPDASLWDRTYASYVTLALSYALLAPFCLHFVEPHAVGRISRRIVIGAAVLLLGIALLVPMLGQSVPFLPRKIYHFAYVPAFLAYAVLIWSGLRSRSSAIWFVLIAWALPVLAGIDRVLRGLDVYALGYSIDFVYYVALALQTVVIAIGVAWRFKAVHKERDRALELERRHAHEAMTDALCGLANRRAFEQRHWREGDFLAVLDVDHFKRVNDRFGHGVGDAVLRAIGSELADSIGNHGLVEAWRLGGEEFAVLVQTRAIDSAAVAINHLRSSISARVGTAVPELDAPLTVSGGLARIDARGLAFAYETADRALYHAKTSGRDRLSWVAADTATATILPRRSQRRAA